jgi:hypothetical protein
MDSEEEERNESEGKKKREKGGAGFLHPSPEYSTVLKLFHAEFHLQLHVVEYVSTVSTDKG